MYGRQLIAVLFMMAGLSGIAEAQIPSSSCATDNSVIQKMLCSDEELAKLDVEMARTYYRLLNSVGEESVEELTQTQRAWGKKRFTLCRIPQSKFPADGFGVEAALHARTCLADMLKSRIDELVRRTKLISADQLADFNRDLKVNLNEDNRWFTQLDVTPNSRLDALRRKRKLEAEFPAISFSVFPPKPGDVGWGIYIASYNSKSHAERTTRIASSIGVPYATKVHSVSAGALTRQWNAIPDTVRDQAIQCIKEGSSTYRDLLVCTGVAFTPVTFRSCILDGKCSIGLRGISANAALMQLGVDWNSPVELKNLPIDPNKIARCREQSAGLPEAFDKCAADEIAPQPPSEATNCRNLQIRPEAFGRCLIAGLQEPVRTVATCFIGLSSPGGADSLDCVTRLLNPDQAKQLKRVSDCVGKITDFTVANAARCALAAAPGIGDALVCFDDKQSGVARVECLVKWFPQFGDAARNIACFRIAATASDVLTTCAPRLDVAVPSNISTCVSSRGSDANALSQCIPDTADGRLRCLKTADEMERRISCLLGDDPKAVAVKAVLCAQSGLASLDAAVACGVPPLDEKTRTVVACLLKDASSVQLILVCAAAPHLDDKARRVLGCAIGAKGYMEFGLCVLGVQVNPEVATIAGCAAESGFEPVATTGCSVGNLTARELEKCRTEIGGDNGCFGKNNTIRLFVMAQLLDPESISKLSANLKTGLEDFSRAVDTVGQQARNLVDKLPGPNADAKKGAACLILPMGCPVIMSWW